MCHRAVVVSYSDLCLCHFFSVNLAGNKCLGLLCFYLLYCYTITVPNNTIWQNIFYYFCVIFFALMCCVTAAQLSML